MRLIPSVVGLALVSALVGCASADPVDRGDASATTPSQRATPPAPTNSASASPSPSSADRCRTSERPFLPATLSLPRLKVRLPVLSQPADEQGRFPVPPLDDPAIDPKWTASWWQDGVAAGADRGVSHFDVHTYRVGGAAGNLFATKVKRGDLIEVVSRSGAQTACYRVTGVRDWPVDKAPHALVAGASGPPGLAIEMCWDPPETWGKWTLRRHVLARLVPSR